MVVARDWEGGEKEEILFSECEGSVLEIKKF